MPVFSFICKQEEREKGEQNLNNIAKTHERMQQEQKSSGILKIKIICQFSFRWRIGKRTWCNRPIMYWI